MKMIKLTLLVVTMVALTACVQRPPPPTITTPLPSTICCPMIFNRTQEGCFYVNHDDRKTWDKSEAACQRYGYHIHLATLDTRQVGTFMLYHSRTTDGTIPVVPSFHWC